MPDVICMAPNAPPKSRPFSGRQRGTTPRSKHRNVSCLDSGAKKQCTPRFAGFSTHGAFVALLTKDLVNLGRSPADIAASRKQGVDMLLANLPKDGGGLKELADKVSLLDSLILALGDIFGPTEDATRVGWVRPLQEVLTKESKRVNRVSVSTQCAACFRPQIHVGTQCMPGRPTANNGTQCNIPTLASSSRTSGTHTATSGTQCDFIALTRSPHARLVTFRTPTASAGAQCNLLSQVEAADTQVSISAPTSNAGAQCDSPTTGCFANIFSICATASTSAQCDLSSPSRNLLSISTPTASIGAQCDLLSPGSYANQVSISTPTASSSAQCNLKSPRHSHRNYLSISTTPVSSSTQFAIATPDKVPQPYLSRVSTPSASNATQSDFSPPAMGNGVNHLSISTPTANTSAQCDLSSPAGYRANTLSISTPTANTSAQCDLSSPAGHRANALSISTPTASTCAQCDLSSPAGYRANALSISTPTANSSAQCDLSAPSSRQDRSTLSSCKPTRSQGTQCNNPLQPLRTSAGVKTRPTSSITQCGISTPARGSRARKAKLRTPTASTGSQCELLRPAKGRVGGPARIRTPTASNSTQCDLRSPAVGSRANCLRTSTPTASNSTQCDLSSPANASRANYLSISTPTASNGTQCDLSSSAKPVSSDSNFSVHTPSASHATQCDLSSPTKHSRARNLSLSTPTACGTPSKSSRTRNLTLRTPTASNSTQCDFSSPTKSIPRASPMSVSTYAGSWTPCTSVCSFDTPTKSRLLEIATQCADELGLARSQNSVSHVGTQIAGAIPVAECKDAASQYTVAQGALADIGSQCVADHADSGTQMENAMSASASAQCNITAQGSCATTQCNIIAIGATRTTQCNISERRTLQGPGQAVAKIRYQLALEKEQGEYLQQRNEELQEQVEESRVRDTTQVRQLKDFRTKVSKLEKKLEAYDKITTDKSVETEEATVWTHSFQHKGGLIRTFDKEVQTARDNNVSFLASPRLDSAMLAFANR